MLKGTIRTIKIFLRPSLMAGCVLVSGFAYFYNGGTSDRSFYHVGRRFLASTLRSVFVRPQASGVKC